MSDRYELHLLKVSSKMNRYITKQKKQVAFITRLAGRAGTGIIKRIGATKMSDCNKDSIYHTINNSYRDEKV